MIMDAPSYNLKWHSHHGETFGKFAQLRERESLVDVNLWCSGGRVIKVHKLVLSACSSQFEKFIRDTSASSAVYFHDIPYDLVSLLVEYMYHGEVEVPSERLLDFLNVGENLGVKGLKKMPDLTGMPLGNSAVGQNYASSGEEGLSVPGTSSHFGDVDGESPLSPPSVIKQQSGSTGGRFSLGMPSHSEGVLRDLNASPPLKKKKRTKIFSKNMSSSREVRLGVPSNFFGNSTSRQNAISPVNGSGGMVSAPTLSRLRDALERPGSRPHSGEEESGDDLEAGSSDPGTRNEFSRSSSLKREEATPERHAASKESESISSASPTSIGTRSPATSDRLIVPLTPPRTGVLPSSLISAALDSQPFEVPLELDPSTIERLSDALLWRGFPREGPRKWVYFCHLCTYLSKHQYNAKVHTRIHTGEKPYVCSQCQRAFSHPSNLKVHMSVHHEGKEGTSKNTTGSRESPVAPPSPGNQAKRLVDPQQ